MDRDLDPFEFGYVATDIAFGRGCLSGLERDLASRDCSRALVVCGANVGANRAVMDRVEAGLGDRLAGVFAGTTPARDMAEVFAGVERLREVGADAIVAVGGGSSLNVARAICAVAPLETSPRAVIDRSRQTGRLPSPEPPTSPVPNVAIPTTMAGADLSTTGAVMLPDREGTDEDSSGARAVRIGDDRLLAAALYYEPSFFETTPVSVLCASAMNGFDKGLETVYSRSATPPGVAHAVYGLRHLRPALLELRNAPAGDGAYDHAVLGSLLVQYGRQTNIIHTFGNGVSFAHDVQQGTVHGIVAPAVLRYVFERVDAERALLADALGAEPADDSDSALADAVIDAVVAVRDALGLPDRLRTVQGLERDALPAIAETIAGNHKHARNPPGIDPTPADVLEVLEAVW